MEKKERLWKPKTAVPAATVRTCPGRAAARKLPIAGCRFTLYPMSDKYIEIILGSLEKTNTSAVWSETDALSTVYRGKLP